ncbi:MAG: head-tail joining protein [Aeromonadaceae bacterium]
MARDPFLRGTEAMIRRLGRHSPATVIDEDGFEHDEIPAIWVNNQSTTEIRKTGKGSGGRDFKASAKRLRVLTADVEGFCPEWVIMVGGVRYFIADHDHEDGGSTVLYLALEQQPKRPQGGSGVWR